MWIKNSKKGFTMIETLVAMGLFGIVISIAAGGFVRALRTQSQIIALVAANSNASLAIEQLAREIRTGYDFECEFDCETLKFSSPSGSEIEEVEYSLLGLKGSAGQGWIGRSVNGGEVRKITADNIDVEYLKFDLQGELPGDGETPRVTISLGISPGTVTFDSLPTRMQTTVSARQITD